MAASHAPKVRQHGFGETETCSVVGVEVPAIEAPNVGFGDRARSPSYRKPNGDIAKGQPDEARPYATDG